MKTRPGSLVSRRNDPAAVELLRDTGTELFGQLRAAPDPGRCSFGISVGEPAVAFTPDEVVATLRDLLRRC